MCGKMKQRSFAKNVFASCAANASDPISHRDHVKHDLLSKIPVGGDMQDMLGYISSQKKIVLITFDYAGLTTDPDDLKTFLQNNPNVHKIIVDNSPHTNKIIDYTSDELINDLEKRNHFSCRKGTLQRSK
ncbi:hypothetical protein BCR42DRAFT_392778 [Absidia repens]|uniref:Uncharacterized protein n=1 Tax=Absidia repens TaxID=90262 RepID=A0A1X2IFZ7_9FUNG|nr:hypothetical protein BCR42DRAFT_392778 [Absidia repens]